MCGRARCTLRADAISGACGINNSSVRNVQIDRYRPRYNVAPGSNVPVVRRGSDGHVLHCMKWGLIPSFTKKTDKPDHYKMFNARSESVSEKASFRRLIPNNRCLVVVEGFYEWKKDGSKKQPYYIHFNHGKPLVLAALYDSWRNSQEEALYTFTILTTSCSSVLQWLHDRMPVILGDQNSIDLWLNGSSSSKFDTLLKPYEESDLVWYPVTPAIGKPSFDGLECIKEIQLKAKEKNLISNFFSKKKDNNEAESNPSSRVPSENIKEEDETTNEHDEKNPSVGEAEEKCGIKQEYEEVEEKCEMKQEHEEADEKCGIKQEYEEAEEKCGIKQQYEEAEEKCGIKRDYIELSSKTEASNDNVQRKRVMSPVKKLAKVKNPNEKQQTTLLSYFGKS
ncbi:hypothetical protein GIB67_024494 [Kingdonia uniflora]|uniref:Embryonic stem cell-specific 5-hydroxymethylcytosine-binding protein n=1 Tax=Kingdonia uniflora TaxID=39325 RepID=A0A7J7LNQ7_9MAGN|nr:hypothetical protein GIB67_024494 [Kingdonia uniflora]